MLIREAAIFLICISATFSTWSVCNFRIPKITGMNNSYWNSTLGRFRLIAILKASLTYIIRYSDAFEIFAHLPDAVKYTAGSTVYYLYCI